MKRDRRTAQQIQALEKRSAGVDAVPDASSIETKLAELSISVGQHDGATVVTATPAQDVTVDAADGLIRFCIGDQFRDIPIDGIATKVRRRRGHLEVTVEKHCAGTE